MKRIFLALYFAPIFVAAQNKPEEPKFGISFSGFVKTDVFYDSRQTINIREGHFLLYPDNILPDANKEDINAKPSFNMLSIQSRLKGAITGPDAFGAKTSGVLEADFFGNESANFCDVNGFRLRHAFVKMNWQTTELLAGQYWHPIFIAESFPAVISFNTGAPFQPFSRNPQLRLTKKFGQLKTIVCLYTQRDFQSTGPDGSSTKYLRNAGMPAVHVQLQFKPDSAEHVFGAGMDYKTLMPELSTKNSANNKTYAASKTIGSLSALAFAKFKFKPVTLKIEGVYAQNATDLTMIGGYAVKQVTDTATGEKEFTNLTTGSVWMELHSNGKKIQVGCFGGYTKNMGSQDSIKSSIYARNANINYVYRVAPRVVFVAGKLNIAIELEYTFAMYGTANGDKLGKPTNNMAVANTRGLMAFIYNF